MTPSGRQAAGNVDGLALPARLVRLIAAGQWPRTEHEMNRLQGDTRLAPDLVRRVRSTETSLVLYPTPFRTVHRRVDMGDRWWLDPCAAPWDIDLRLAVPIGDFGLGSDAPIVLDYRADRARPRVLGLLWRECGTANSWDPIADSFDEFCDRLELEAYLPVFAGEERNATRHTMLDLLRLLADPEAQRAYERNVPIAQVPAELFCMWFDDQYHPDSVTFQEAFDPVERAALARFHAVFSEVADRMPERIGRVAELHARREWPVVVQAAARVLAEIGEGDDAGNRG